MNYFRSLVLPLAILSFCFVMIQWKTILKAPQPGTDFTIYYKAAADFPKATPTLYNSATAGFDQYLYPPPSIFLFRCFLVFPPETAYLLFTAIMYGCAIAAISLLLSLLQIPRPIAPGLLIFAAASAPVYHNLVLGQVDCLVLLLCICYLYYLPRRPILAGILLAFAIWIKVYPVLVLFPALFSAKGRKTILPTILTCLLIPLLTLPFIGVQLYGDFIRKMIDTSQFTCAQIINQSFSAFGVRTSLPTQSWFQWPSIYRIPGWLKTANYCLLALFLILSALGTRRQDSPLRWTSLMLASGAMISPLGWGHTFVFCLPLLLLCGKELLLQLDKSGTPLGKQILLNAACWTTALLFLIPVYSQPAFLNRCPAILQTLFYSRFFLISLLLSLSMAVSLLRSKTKATSFL